MQTLLLIGFMVIIGAFIGGMTNSLAIKMLFRPYNAIKIGTWRLPLTPGLIPKRRDELATQLGETVVKYLLTAEGLSRKLNSTSFIQGNIKWIQGKVEEILRSNVSIAELMEKHIGTQFPKQILLDRTESFVTNSYRSFIDTHRENTLAAIIPVPIQQNVDKQIPNVTNYILMRAQDFLQSSEGKDRLSMMVDRFLAQKGKIGNMVSMFLGQERLVDKLQPELMKFLRDEGTNQLVERLLIQEWDKIKQKKVADLEGYVNEEDVVSFIVKTVDEQIPLYQWIDQPLNEWTDKYEEKVINSFIPKAVTIMLDMLVVNLDSLLDKFHLDEIVTEQVQAFSTEHIEELVLSIAKRELKMITYLGALLGGVIGLVQSFIVIMTG